MKRIALLLTTILLMSAITACSSTTISDGSKPENASSTQSGTSIPESSSSESGSIPTGDKEHIVNWAFRTNMSTDYKFPEIEAVTMDIPGTSVSTTVYTSRFFRNADDIISELRSLPFIKDTYRLADGYEERGVYGKHYADVGDMLGYKYARTLYGVTDEAEYDRYYAPSEFAVEIGGNTYQNDTEYVKIVMPDVNTTENAQEHLYDVAEIVFGKDVAEIFCFVDDRNPDDALDIEYSPGTGDNGTYQLKRTFYKDREGNVQATFYLGINTPQSRTLWSVADYAPAIKEFPYEVADVLGKDLGGKDITHFSTYLNKYFSSTPGYIRTTPAITNTYIYKHIKADNGNEIYSYNNEVYKCMEGYGTVTAPYLKADYKLVVKDGKILDYDYDIEGRTQHVSDTSDRDKAIADSFELIKSDLKYLFKTDFDIELGEDNEIKTMGKIEFAGIESDADVTVTFKHNGAVETFVSEWRVKKPYTW